MLPLVRKNTFHVPHGLAAVAACICLALAFSTDLKDRESRILTEQSRSAEPSRVVSLDESRTEPHRQTEHRPRETAPRRAPRQLLPWFPGLHRGSR